VPSSASLSAKRRRQIVAVLLSAFALLAAASVATFHRPAADARFWQSPNACGPVGAGLAWLLAWALGHVAALFVPLIAAVWAWNRLRDEPVLPLLLKTGLGALLVFEVCTLFGLASLDRWTWSGGWGLASSLALQTSLGRSARGWSPAPCSWRARSRRASWASIGSVRSCMARWCSR
jgi:hypothetical protein